MPAKGYFSVAARKREKQVARLHDERVVACGPVSAASVSKRNSFFGGLNSSKARISRRRVHVRVAAV